MNRFHTIKQPTKEIISFGLAAKVLNIIKSVLLAYYIGVNYKMDTYVLAFSTTMLLTTIVADGILLSLIPPYQHIEGKRGKEGKREFTSVLITFFTIVGLGFVVFGYIIAPWLIRVLGPGFKAKEMEDTIKLFRLGTPILILHSIRTICGAYLQSEHRFKAGAKASVINPLIYIIYLVLFGDTFGLEGLIIAGLIAVLGQVVVLIKPLIKDGFRYRFIWDTKSIALKNTIRSLIPIMIAIGVNQLNTTIDNGRASTLLPGSISQLGYASEITSLISGLFIGAMITALFPILTENYYKDEIDELKSNINFAMNLLLIVALPLSLILMKLSHPIVTIFYQRGEFGALESQIISEVLKYYGVGLIGTVLVMLVIRIYYAIQDTNTPMILGIIHLSINFVLNIILAEKIGVKGIALATSISAIVTALYGIYDLNRKIGFIQGRIYIKNIVRIAISLIIMGLIIGVSNNYLSHIISNTFLGNLFNVLLSSIIGISVYGISLKRFLHKL